MNKLFSLENQGLFELYPMRMPMRAAVFCRRTVCFLMKHPIKLGEAVKPQDIAILDTDSSVLVRRNWALIILTF